MSSYLDRLKTFHASFVEDGMSRGYSEGASRLALNIYYKRRIYQTHRREAAKCTKERRAPEADHHRSMMLRSFRDIQNTVATAVCGRDAVALLREREAAR